MSAELLKLLVQAVIIERDADGKIIGERLTAAKPLYTQADIDEFVATVHAEIAAFNKAARKKA